MRAGFTFNVTVLSGKGFQLGETRHRHLSTPPLPPPTSTYPSKCTPTRIASTHKRAQNWDIQLPVQASADGVPAQPRHNTSTTENTTHTPYPLVMDPSVQDRGTPSQPQACSTPILLCARLSVPCASVRVRVIHVFVCFCCSLPALHAVTLDSLVQEVLSRGGIEAIHYYVKDVVSFGLTLRSCEDSICGYALVNPVPYLTYLSACIEGIRAGDGTLVS